MNAKVNTPKISKAARIPVTETGRRAVDSLAVRYRPRWIKEILGAGPGIKAIANQLASGDLRRTIMITGPVGTGKTTLARVIAQSILCNSPGPDGKPCFNCDSCKCFKANGVHGHPSYIEENMAVETGVDNMRGHVRLAQVKSLLSKYRVFVFDEAQELGAAAKNAMLKLIEEPPADAIIIICSMSREKFSDKVGKAIMSRCFHAETQQPTESEVVNRLRKIAERENHNPSDALLKAVASVSDRMMRDALTVLDVILSSGSYDIPDTEADTFVSRLAGKSPYELAKNVLIGLYKSDIARVVEAVSSSDNTVFLAKSMIEMNANIIKFRHLPASIASKPALWNAQELSSCVNASDAAVAKVGLRIQELYLSVSNHAFDAGSAIVHLAASIERKS